MAILGRLVILTILMIAVQAGDKDSKDICKQPQIVGSCRGAFPRWWFNDATKNCELFAYGGCDGNENNFVSQEECIKLRDACKIVDLGPPNKGMCKQPKIVGPCRSSLPRWWYNSQTKQCESFLYGGCEGNENNFESEEECGKLKDICKSDQIETREKDPKEICKLSSDKGPCRGTFLRWWYNAATKQCETFAYGGCRGNENNFKTVEECGKLRDVCLKTDLIESREKDACKLPKVIGPCKGAYVRWWYNAEKKSCEKFIYGGCEGNVNNFKDESDCNTLKKDCELA